MAEGGEVVEYDGFGAPIIIGNAGDPWVDLGWISRDGLIIEAGDAVESFSTSTHDLGGVLDLSISGEIDADFIRRLAGITATPEIYYSPFSVLVDYVEWVSGKPPWPAARRGWRGLFDRVTGRQRHAERLHCIKLKAWWRAGCPDVPITVRRYIPRAHVHAELDGTYTFTAASDV